MKKILVEQDKQTWVKYITSALKNLGGRATLQNIYAEIEDLRGAAYLHSSPNWKANVQTTIYQHCSDSGMWDTYRKRGIYNQNLFYKFHDKGKIVGYGLRNYHVVMVAEDASNELPPRIKSVIQRIVRDTKRVRELKLLYNDQCQCCGQTLVVNEQTYSEGHHLKPLGKPHNGPDVKSNIVVLCPNCHVQFDYFAVELNLEKLTFEEGHKLDTKYIDYYNNRRNK